MNPPRLLAAALVAWMALLPPASAAPGPISVNLTQVEVTVTSGTSRLRVDSRARFSFDPETRTLSSAGSWSAQNELGPSRIPRLAHRFDDLRLTQGLPPTARSYECTEGTFGASIGANLCGNYLFGPNGLDDGGFGDDIHQGPPKSLDDFVVAEMAWDGRKLVVTLDAVVEGAAVYPEKRLQLTFTTD